jgi:hypothetical protein
VCAVLTNELTAFGPLLDLIDITGAIITADALHAPHRHVDYLAGRGAHLRDDGETQPVQPAPPAAGPILGDDPFGGEGPLAPPNLPVERPSRPRRSMLRLLIFS